MRKKTIHKRDQWIGASKRLDSQTMPTCVHMAHWEVTQGTTPYKENKDVFLFIRQVFS